MPDFVDRTGERFTRLLVLERAPRRGTMRTMWRCRCDCGRELDVYARNLVKGSSRSCGCLMRELSSQRGGNRIHGMSGTRAHNAWRAAKERCSNPHNKKYADYGGRGIRMAEAWAADFRVFLVGVGAPPTDKHELDRIDPDGNYEPGNCRWATRTEQMHNRRTTTLIRDGDEALTVGDFARRHGLKYQTVISRIGTLGIRGQKDASGEELLAFGRV